MKRKLTQKLIDWKNRPNHKPLILQGTRQVGKHSFPQSREVQNAGGVFRVK